MINNKARMVSADEYADRQAQINSTLSDLHTSIPAIVISFNADERTVTAQPAIQRVFTDGAGMTGAINLPPCVDVPVIFLSGGGYEITYPINEGDECLLMFSERCIDSWFVSGTPSPPDDYRKHDLSDAFALVGVKSLANKKPVPMDGLHIGNEKSKVVIGKDQVQLKQGKAVLTLTEDRLSSNVDIYCPNVITDDFDVNNHVHDGIEVGGGSTTKGK